MSKEKTEHQESTKPPLLITDVSSSAYFAILGCSYIVIHASTMDRALKWLEQEGYQWSSVKKIRPKNIY